MSDAAYIGGELELFAHVRHWKRYWSERLRPWVSGSVLEVGAGLGANTLLLRTEAFPRWVCLEPDSQLVAALRERLAAAGPLAGVEVRTGDLGSLPDTERFDTLLYIDVLEHIADDAGELCRAAAHLQPGGQVVVLAPAHPWLFSPFDAAIGHHRRYTVSSLRALTPPALRPVRSFYLDAVGLLASAANRLLLRQSLPTVAQLRVWDNWMVPCSRVLDPLTGHRLGKTVVAIWERRG
jgi:SAM-dependent methyltransferase